MRKNLSPFAFCLRKRHRLDEEVSMMFEWQPVILSLKIASCALLSVVLGGVAGAYLMARRDFPGKVLVETVITLPLVLPPIVSGFLLLVAIGRRGPIGLLLQRAGGSQLIFTPLAAVLAAALIALPLMYQSAKAALQGVNHNLEDAARTLGSGEWRVFRTITLPLAWPGILSGMVLSFARALGEFGATAMVAGNIPGKTQTVPVAIFFAAESNDLTTAGLYVLLISGLTFGLTFVVNRWARRQTVRLGKGGQSDVKGGVRKAITGIPVEDRI
jgi:molybdate transport system permease protein